jgi:hypothetical protein
MANINVKIKEFNDAKKGEVLYFDGFKWVPVSLELVFRDLKAEIDSLKTETESLKITLRTTKDQIQTELNTQRQTLAELLKGIVK